MLDDIAVLRRYVYQVKTNAQKDYLIKIHIQACSLIDECINTYPSGKSYCVQYLGRSSGNFCYSRRMPY